MLSIPVFDQIEDITVYRDDEDRGRFYYLPRAPKIVVGPDGAPEFIFYRYQNPIERAGAEKGGGYLLFTTSISESQDRLDSIQSHLQGIVNAENPNDPTPPRVTLAPVQFTEGEVQLIFFRSNQFVKSLNLGKPSLQGDNSASVAVELNESGAELLYEGLMHGAGVAAIEYDLTYPVRLPAIEVRGHIDSSEIKHAAMGMTVEMVRDDSVWGDEWNPVEHRTSISETLHNQGLVKLEILKGSVDLKQEDEEAIRGFAFSVMDEFVKKHFMSGGTIETPEDRQSAWMQAIDSDITNNFDLDASMRDVINYQYRPNSQVGTAFLGVPAERVVIDVDLQDAPWYHNLEVQVTTNLDWARFGDVVHSVVGHFSYDQARDDGTRSTAVESLMFTPDDNKPKTFDAHVAKLGRDSYDVTIEVNYKAGPVTQRTLSTVTTNKRALTLDVPNPGLIDVDFAVDPGVFGDKLSSIEVEVGYGDPRRHVPDAVETLVLDGETATRNYRRWLFAPFDQPLRYRTTYVIKDAAGGEQRSTGPWVPQEPGLKLYLTIHSPFEDVLQLRIIPSVDWTEVAAVVVDLEYEDLANDLREQTTFSFTKDAKTGFQDWRFPLRDAGARTFRYRQTLLLTNAGRESTGWITVTDNPGTLVVGNAPGGVVTLQVDPADTGIGTGVTRVVARMRYQDSAHSVHRGTTLVFRNATPQTWAVARADATVNDYEYDVEYVMNDGSHRQLKDQTGVLNGGISDYLALPAAPVA